MKLSVVITAGGTSSRYGQTNKLLEKIDGKEVIIHSIEAFLPFNTAEIIISTSESLEKPIVQLLKEYNLTNIKLVRGGFTRQQSVFNALNACVYRELVAIHDAARPLAKQDDIAKCIQKAAKTKAAIVAVRAVDTIKRVDENLKIVETPNRETLWYVQTPQIFDYSLIMDAHNTLEGLSFSDDAGMLESLGVDVFISEGSYSNIKITTKKDIYLAQMLYANQE